MMRMLVTTILPVGLMFSAAPVASQERSLATQYRLPANISNEMRPYLLCGLIHERSDTGTLVNGVRVLMHGQGLAGCRDVRARALAASEQRLASTMADPATRKSYVEAEFGKADEFLRTATKLDDLGVGQEPTAPPCRNSNAGH